MNETVSRRTFHPISLVFVGVGVSLLLFIGYAFREKPTLSPIPEEPKRGIFESFFTKKKDPKELKRQLLAVMGPNTVKYSVIVSDLKSDFRVDINEMTIHTAASVNKLPILAALYYQAQKSVIDLDTIITIQANDIQDYGTGIIRYQEAGVTYSIKTLAMLMVKKSDNTAAYVLGNQIIGMDTVQALITGWGLEQTDMENNKTSIRDMERLMRKIYGENVANHPYTLDMFSMMKDTDFEDRLPRLLPSTVDVYHKIGTEVGRVHDVGIVIDGDTAYFIAVLSSDMTKTGDASDIIATISKVAYDFMKH